MSNCTPNFVEGVSFSCILEFVNDVRAKKSIVDLSLKGLWIAGCIVTTFKVVQSPVTIMHDVSVASVADQIELKCKDILDIIGESNEDSPRAYGVDWVAILNLILEIIKLLPRS